jgi:hypothetical protein
MAQTAPAAGGVPNEKTALFEPELHQRSDDSPPTGTIAKAPCRGNVNHNSGEFFLVYFL